MPIFLQKVLQQARLRPGAALCFLLLAGVIGYWYSSPRAQNGSSIPEAGRAVKVPGLAAQRHTLEGTVVEVKNENDRLKQALDEQKRTLATLEQRHQAALQTAETKAAAQEQRLAALAVRAEQGASQSQQRRREPPKAPPPPARPQAPPPPVVAPPHVETGKIEFLRSKTPSVFTRGVGPSPVHHETGYIAPACYANARLVTGVFATANRDGLLPIALVVTTNPYCPAHLQGPDTEPKETSVPIKGCMVLGKSTADLSSHRVHIQAEKMSCIFPDKATFEPDIKAYVTGEDGSLGVPGDLERRTGAYIAQALIASLLGGASEALALSKRSIVTTPFGGSIGTQSGGNPGAIAAYGAAQRSADRVADWALRQAQGLLPVLWVKAGTEAKIVFQEGVALEGLPTQVVRYREER